jgi:hypothetical protein
MLDSEEHALMASLTSLQGHLRKSSILVQRMRSVFGEMMIALLGVWSIDSPRGMVMKPRGGEACRDLVEMWTDTACGILAA